MGILQGGAKRNWKKTDKQPKAFSGRAIATKIYQNDNDRSRIKPAASKRRATDYLVKKVNTKLSARNAKVGIRATHTAQIRPFSRVGKKSYL